MISINALLDSGSQVNLISARAIKMLKLKFTDSMLKIKGMGGRENTSLRRVSIMLRSKATGFTTRIEAFVLPHILDDQPSKLLDKSLFKIPSNMTMADPIFFQPGKIDLLLGALSLTLKTRTIQDKFLWSCIAKHGAGLDNCRQNQYYIKFISHVWSRNSRRNKRHLRTILEIGQF